MPISVKTFLEKGYVPIACNSSAGIAWEGEYLGDFWMWNRQFIEDRNGARTLQTVKVATVKEAALRWWKDGWVPLKEPDAALVLKMEEALRGHRGLKREGVVFPEGPFLKREDIEEEKIVREATRSRVADNRQKQTARSLKINYQKGKDE